MASFTRESKFRHCVVSTAKREAFYENIKTLIPQNDINGVAGNSSLLCYLEPSGSGSALGVLPLTSVGKNHIPITSPAYQQPIIRAHSQPIQDFDCNPFHRQQVITCSLDTTVKVWEYPEEGLTVDLTTPVSTLTTNKKFPVRGMSVNKTSEGIVAVRGSRDISILDVGTGAEVLSAPENMFTGDMQSMSWSHKGDLLVTTSKDKMLRLIDIRSVAATSSGGAAATVTAGHQGLRFSRTVWLGDTPYFVSVGHNNSQEREYMLWDSRSMEKAVKRERIDNSTGPLIPMFDADLNLLTIAGKGDSSVRMYELDSASPDMLCPLSNTNIGEPIRGFGMLPKQACDRMNTEVLRFLKLGEGVIQPVSVSVPRKEKWKYQEDLYPPTFCEGPAAQSGADWMAGNTAEPCRIPLPELTAGTASSSSSSSGLSLDSPGSAAATAGDATTPGSSSTSPVPGGSSRSTSPMPAGGRSSVRSSTGLTSLLKYRHMFGTENKKEDTVFNLQPDLSSVDSPILACSEEYIALPYKGGGGPVYVAPLNDCFGKAKTEPSLINGHKQAVSDIAFSPFRSELMATGSMDCSVKLWDVSNNSDYSSLEPLQNFNSHSNSVRSVQFHPTVPNLLTSVGQDATLRFFDTEAGEEVSCFKVFDGGDGGMCANISFNYDGTLLAAAGKDRLVRIIDPRTSSTVLISESSESAADGGAGLSPKSPARTLGRNLRVAWCSNQSLFDPIVTVSGMNTGLRTLHIWDPRSMNKPLQSKMIDNGSGQLFPMWDEGLSVLFLAGKGDTIIRTYEIVSMAAAGLEAGAPVDSLSRDDQLDAPIFFEKSAECQTNAREPMAGVCMLPKRSCNVRNIETARLLKLTSDAIIPLSFKAPRADHLKQYFHDDIFPPVRSKHTEVSVEDWKTPDLPASFFKPVLESLRPDDMVSISEKPADLVAPSEAKSKVASFRHSMKLKEEEDQKREDGFNRLQALAQQNAKYNVNLSGGGGSGAVRAKGEVAVLATADDSDSDNNWDD